MIKALFKEKNSKFNIYLIIIGWSENMKEKLKKCKSKLKYFTT